MKTSLFFTFCIYLSAFICSLSSAENYVRHYDPSIVANLDGRIVPFDGPNCVDAAIISQAPQFPFMMVDPKFAQKSILPQCFKETDESSGDLVGYFNDQGELIHIFALLNNGQVFSKNGLDSQYPFKITTESDIYKQYREHVSATKHYQWAPKNNCAIVSFPEYVSTHPILRRLEDSIQALIFKKGPSEPEVSYSTLEKMNQSLTGQDPMTELAKELVWTAFALPQYEEARNKADIAQYLNGISAGLHISDEEVKQRLKELKKLYSFTLRVFSTNGAGEDLIEMLRNYKTFHITGFNQVPTIQASMGCPLTESECTPVWEKVKNIKDQISKEGKVYREENMVIDTKKWLLKIDEHIYHFENIGIYTPSPKL